MCGTSSTTIQQHASTAINLPQQQATTQVAGQHGHGTTAHAHVGPGIPPKSSPVIQQYLVDGSYGPTVKKGKAKTISIKDGRGFGNVSGRKQNGDDKGQNNYSVTDANFFPTMGVLQDVATGKPMNYVKQIQAYNAVGYVSTFHPDVYQKMVATQDAGQGTVLGMALNLMGAQGAQVDPGMAAAGLQTGAFASENVPGSTLNAHKVVMSGTDISGEEWARPHHAESSWAVYKNLIDAGLDWKSAMAFSGDDAISGSGRMNGFNNQDGKDGFNADEAAMFRIIAVAQRTTGIPVFDIVAGGHSHTGIDASAKKNPNINKLIGLPHDDMSSSPDRMNRILNALLDGTIESTEGHTKQVKIKATGAYEGAGGEPPVLQYAKSAVLGASGSGDKKIDVAQAPMQHRAPQQHDHLASTAPVPGGGADAPSVSAGGGCAHDPAQGASLIGGGPSSDVNAALATALQQLVAGLTALIQALGSLSGTAAATGGGAKAPEQVGQQPNQQAQQLSAAQHAHAGHH